jgi:sugar phosphate isomerase/epimerase
LETPQGPPLRLATQTILLPGRDVAEQFANAAAWGFDAVEVAVGPAFHLAEHLGAVRRASEASGLPVAAICTHPIHDPIQPDAAERARRFDALTALLAQADELGAAGVVSVPVRPARGFASLAEQEREFDRLADLTVGAFTEWADGLPAGRAAVFLEPLCRFEASFLNTVGQAVGLSRRIGSPRVLALADFFHMNIEERDLVAPFAEAGDRLGHVHIADNTRLQPGRGLIPFGPSFAALRRMGYGGYVSIECFSPAGPRIEGDPAVAFPETVRFLCETWDAAASPSDADARAAPA